MVLNITNLITTQSRLLTTLQQKLFENIVGKGENAGYQHFLLFPQCFLPIPNKNFCFWIAFMLSYAKLNALDLDQWKILWFGKDRVLPRNQIQWDNGPLSLKKVGHFRKYGARVNFPYMTPVVYHYLDLET